MTTFSDAVVFYCSLSTSSQLCRDIFVLNVSTGEGLTAWLLRVRLIWIPVLLHLLTTGKIFNDSVPQLL